MGSSPVINLLGCLLYDIQVTLISISKIFGITKELIDFVHTILAPFDTVKNVADKPPVHTKKKRHDFVRRFS